LETATPRLARSGALLFPYRHGLTQPDKMLRIPAASQVYPLAGTLNVKLPSGTDFAFSGWA
jgi:hypothetical protein